MTYTNAIDALTQSKKVLRYFLVSIYVYVSTNMDPYQRFKYPVQWGMDLKFEHEQWLARDYCEGPVFVTDYPSKLKPFYMRENDDSTTVSCFDLLVPGIGELAGGSAREDRLDILEKRMQSKGLSSYHATNGSEESMLNVKSTGSLGLSNNGLEWYMDLRRFGSVPHAGTQSMNGVL